jgi:hypothetical protein
MEDIDNNEITPVRPVHTMYILPVHTISIAAYNVVALINARI